MNLTTQPAIQGQKAPAIEAQKGPSPIQARALLAQCRDVARGRLRRISADALQRMEADLFAMAEGSKSREQQNAFFDIIAKVRDHREEIARTFEKMVSQVFDEKLLIETKKKKEAVVAVAEKLELVDDGQLMEGAHISDLAKRTQVKIDPKEMFGLRTRLAHLLGVETLEDERNPLGAETVMEALDRTCGEYTPDTDARRSLLGAFQPYIAEGMTDVYAEVNAMLVARNILPRIKPAIQRSVGTSTIPGMSALDAALARSGAHPLNQLMSATQPMNGGAQFSQPGMFTQPPSRLSGTQPMNTASLAGGSGPVIGLSAEATAALAQIAVGPSDARRQIVRMLAEPTRHSFDAAIATPATPELIKQLTALQGQLAMTENITHSWLRALDQDVRTHSHPLDQLTIDFVAALFDIIFHDKNISDAVKAELARLQIIAVKAAIVDRSFFARRQHPMRHFLDRIAECAADPDLETEPNSWFVTGLRTITDELNANFNDDLSLIAKALEQVEALIAQHNAGEVDKAPVNTAEIEAHERRELALTMAAVELKRRATDPVPKFVHTFLQDWWTRALVDAYANQREGKDAWAHRLGVIDSLVWSLRPLRSTSVGKLATQLPELMKDLTRGMTAAEMPQEERKRFFDALMAEHTRIIREAKATPRPASPQAGADAFPQTVPAPQVLAPLDPDSPDFAAASTEGSGSGFHNHVVNAIEKGAVLEFGATSADGQDIWQRFKLSWISPKRSIFMFTARATKPRQLSRAELVAAFEAGTARVLDSSERYMDQAIETLAVNAK